MSQAGDVDVKEDISISDNEVGIRPVINEEVDIVKNIESFDYNCCCYCTDEFPSAEIRDKHEFHCPMGPQLTVRLLIANLNESQSRARS
ncbi:unnamed protein product [Acanthoscelides obtectus]|uniref:Uncharacterized protein n=1 Tax=Acanthoscelides obtectus TaxID=200917 RepID=A0A9P0NRM2_ACAOB|nr:unnamed protein product [Acanthoscelides obtectus]CAK1665698.1 hypothetical protein AOBTE_LOCUS24925 [Acanthoscelides obtectus]